MSKQVFAPTHRRAIWTAHKYKCFYCRQPVRWDALRIDHVVPEHFVGRPDERARVLADLGLPDHWDLTADSNLVAACDPCNGRKRARLPERNQVILWLAEVRDKVTLVAHLRERYEREQKEDQLRAQLEIALAAGLLNEKQLREALTNNADKDGPIRLTSEIEFLDGISLDRLRPSDAMRFLDVPVRLGAILPEGLRLVRDGAPDRYVRSCREYHNAVSEGYYALTNFEIKMAAFFSAYSRRPHGAPSMSPVRKEFHPRAARRSMRS